MSEVYEKASVSTLLADYAAADQNGRVQIIGGGLQVLNLDPSTGATQAFALLVALTFPADVFNEQYAFEVVLETPAGEPVEMGGDAGVLRLGQNQQVEEPTFPGAGIPRRSLPSRGHVVVFFNNGLPLPDGQPMQFRVRIDGQTRPDWVAPIVVVAPPGGPVIG